MNKKIGIATASLIALSAITIGGAIPAVAQSSPAADQDDKKDKQDRASNAHHGKKHGHSSAHGINSLGTTLGSAKKGRSSATFGAAHPPIKLQKLKQSLAGRGTHKIGLATSVTGPSTPGINFALIGRDAPNGQSPYFSTKADRFITNSVVAQLFRAGMILPDGSVAKGAESIITVGRPSATPQVPRYSRPPTQQNNFTPPTPILGTPAPIDFAGLAAANPTGASSFYSVQGSKYLSNKDALQLHEVGLISTNGTLAPSMVGELENHGPNYVQAPTPPNLGIAQTPPTPNVSAPVPPNLGGNQTPTATKFRRPPTAQNNFTPPTPILGTPAPIDFAGLAATNPTGSSIFYSILGSKYVDNQTALAMHQAGLISANGIFAPSIAGDLENRGPNYFQAPTPPNLGIAQTPPTPNVSAPVPPNLGTNQTPPVPVVQTPTPPTLGIAQIPTPNVTAPVPPNLGTNQTPPVPVVQAPTPPTLGIAQTPTPNVTAPVPPNLGGNQTPTATKFRRPPTQQNNFTPPTPILGTPAPIDFAGLAAANPTGASSFYSILGSKYVDNQTALAMHKAGLISTNGIFAPSIAGNFENRGPNYVQAPTPPALGNAQTPQSPNVSAPVPPQLANNQTPAVRGNNAPEPANLGNNQIPIAPVIGTPPGLDIANLTANPGGRSTYYSLPAGQFLTNVDVLKLYETGLILANGSLTPNVAGRIEYRGPNYVQAPTPSTLGNAQTPPTPNISAPMPPKLANNQTPLIQTTHNSLEHGNLLGETEAAIDANQILAKRQVLGHVVVVGIKLPEFEELNE